MCMSRRTTGILFRFIQAIGVYQASDKPWIGRNREQRFTRPFQNVWWVYNGCEDGRTTDFEKSAFEIISTYFGKEVIEKIFDCFKNWFDLQPVRHFEEGNIDVYIFICYLAYLALALYTHHLGVTDWAGVEDSQDELGRIRKTTLDFGDESRDKISVLTKEQRAIIKKLGFADVLF